GNLQDQVSGEKNSEAEAKDGVVEPQIVLHSDSGVSHAGAIEKICTVEQKQKGKQPNRNFAPRVRFFPLANCAANSNGNFAQPLAPHSIVLWYPSIREAQRMKTILSKIVFASVVSLFLAELGLLAATQPASPCDEKMLPAVVKGLLNSRFPEW